MASLRKESDRGRDGWRLQFRVGGQRKSLWLGSLSKRGADAIARHVEELSRAKDGGVGAAADSVAWAQSIEGRMRETLVSWGLADPISTKLTSDEGRFLGAYCDAYIEGRSDIQESSKEGYRHARRLLVEFFGVKHLLRAMTPADALRWQRWLANDKGHAAGTISKYTKRAKSMFTEAVRDRLLTASPFDGLKPGSDVNRTRDHFIDRATAQTILNACPDHEWRMIFALARFAGLRRCELLTITWTDILWDVGKLRIDSPKTGLRYCPIFPEVKQILRDAQEAAPDGSTRCLERYSRLSNLGPQMDRVVTLAGIVPWEKTFQNLRSSRRTELQERFPDHVINEWLGHSSAVAAKHYLQVTPEHWDLGAEVLTGVAVFGGVPGGVVPADSESSTEGAKGEKPRKSGSFANSRRVRKTRAAARLGNEETHETRGKTDQSDSAVSVAVSSAPEGTSIDGTAVELLAIWGCLNTAARLDLLAVARGLASGIRSETGVSTFT